MQYLIFVLTLFMLSPAWGGEYSITIGKSKVGTPQILNLEKLGVLFKYPSDWSLGEQNEKCNIIYKINYAQININHFKFSKGGLSLKEFVRQVQSQMNPPYNLKKDNGIKRIHGKEFWVHDLYKKGVKKANFKAFFMITEKNYGLWILTTYGGRRSYEEVLDVVGSVQKTVKKVSLFEHQGKEVKAETSKRDGYIQDQKYTVFGEYNVEGSFKGKVFLSDLSSKSDYPVYLAFYPVRKVKKEKPRNSRNNFIVSGKPVFIATDKRGKYRVDLPEGYWWVDAYRRSGIVWKLLKGGDVFKSSRAKKMHNLKIDNKS